MTNIFIFIIYRKQHNFILLPNPSKYSFSHSLAQRKGKLHLNPKNFISASISGFRLLSTKTRVANRSPFHFNVSAPGDLRRRENEEGRHCEADQRRGLRIRDRQEGCHGFSDHPEHAHFSRYISVFIFSRRLGY